MGATDPPGWFRPTDLAGWAPWLWWLPALPLIGALAILLLARGDDETVARNAKQVALANSVVVFLLSLLLWTGFDRQDPGFQFTEEYTWLAQYNIAYRVGVDGISVLFVLLSTLLTPLCILSAWSAVKTRVKEYMVAFLVLEALMIGTFVALLWIIAMALIFAGLLAFLMETRLATRSAREARKLARQMVEDGEGD